MLRVAVDVLQQRQEFGFKSDVIVGTSQSSLGAELAERDAAVGADQLIEFLKLLLVSRPSNPIRPVARLGCLGALQVFLSTRFAKVQLVRNTFADFRDVQGGWLGAAATFLHETEPISLQASAAVTKNSSLTIIRLGTSPAPTLDRSRLTGIREAVLNSSRHLFGVKQGHREAMRRNAKPLLWIGSIHSSPQCWTTYAPP